jgi:VIT1/CCC1 family predicted Fe2+/Mn2+ transporter
MSTPESKSRNGDGKSLDQADRKIFYITLIGGLAANIGTVLIVGAAIAIDKLLFSPQYKHSPWVVPIVVILVCVCSAALAAAVEYISPKRSVKRYIFLGFIPIFIMCLIGYAAGFGK